MIKPLHDRVLVKPIENPEYSKGGVFTGEATTTFVADQHKTRQTTVGEVLAVGPGKYNKKGNRRPPDAPIGSIVAFSDTCGQRVEVGGEDYMFIRESDIAFFMDEVAAVEHQYDNEATVDYDDYRHNRLNAFSI